MNNFQNCTETKDDDGNKIIICNNCLTKYKIETDGIKAPYNERGTEKCQNCDIILLTWKNRIEPYLVKVEDK